MNNQTVLIILRLLHVVGGIFWVGSALFMAWFLLPAQRAAGPAGGDFVRRVMFERKLVVYMPVALTLTLLSGFLLYGRMGSAWARSNSGIAFGIGGGAALLAAVVGMIFGSRTGRKIAALGKTMQAAGGAPDPARAAEMSALQGRALTTARVVSTLLLFAACMMAVARYV
jgi:uncharacterized membrane protein